MIFDSSARPFPHHSNVPLEVRSPGRPPSSCLRVLFMGDQREFGFRASASWTCALPPVKFVLGPTLPSFLFWTFTFPFGKTIPDTLIRPNFRRGWVVPPSYSSILQWHHRVPSSLFISMMKSFEDAPTLDHLLWQRPVQVFTARSSACPLPSISGLLFLQDRTFFFPLHLFLGRVRQVPVAEGREMTRRVLTGSCGGVGPFQ